MKKLLLLLGCIYLTAFANGLDYGVQWVIGDKESVLDFRNDTLTN